MGSPNATTRSCGAALNPRSGERVLEQGCGGGFYTYEIARFVGPQGRVAAIDISADQITAARERCREMSWVECQIANANELPHGGGEFDTVFGVQVLEYIQDFEKALREAHRVLRPGGRFPNLATNWTSLLWHSDHPERMHRVLQALATHAPPPGSSGDLGARAPEGRFPAPPPTSRSDHQHVL